VVVENLGNYTVSMSRNKPVRYRAYCCPGPEVAIKELQEIFMPKYFIKNN